MFNLNDYRLESGKLMSYAFPGGYPVYYLAGDGEIICPECANENIELVTDKDNKDWHIVASDVNYESNDLYCCNCSERIEAAYGD